MLHRLRKAAESGSGTFSGPVEADETYIGGKRNNMSNAKRRELADAGVGRGAVGKTAVVGVKDRATKQVPREGRQKHREADPSRASSSTTPPRPGVPRSTAHEASAYEGLPFPHESVKHSVKEYVRGQVHTNGVESFWSMLKRGYVGIYHKMSPKASASLRQRVQPGATTTASPTPRTQMGNLIRGMARKRLTYEELTAPNELDSGARGG